MRPAAVATVLATFGRRQLSRIALEPSPDVEVIELLAPEHAGEGLALDAPHVLVRDAFLHHGVEGIGLGNALFENVVEAAEGLRARLTRAQPHADGGRAAGRNGAHIKRARFGAFACGVDRLVAAVNHMLVERVLKISLGAPDAE